MFPKPGIKRMLHILEKLHFTTITYSIITAVAGLDSQSTVTLAASKSWTSQTAFPDKNLPWCLLQNPCPLQTNTSNYIKDFKCFQVLSTVASSNCTAQSTASGQQDFFGKIPVNFIRQQAALAGAAHSWFEDLRKSSIPKYILNLGFVQMPCSLQSWRSWKPSTFTRGSHFFLRQLWNNPHPPQHMGNASCTPVLFPPTRCGYRWPTPAVTLRGNG